MASIKVSLRKKSDSKGLHQIQVIYTHKSEKFPVSIGKIKQAYWDEASQSVSKDHIQSQSMNQKILDQIRWFDSIRRSIELKGNNPTVTAMRKIKDGLKHEDKSIIDALREYVLYERGRDSEASVKKTITLIGIIEKFIAIEGDILLNEVNYEFRNKLQVGCINGTYTHRSKGVVNSTVHGYIKQFQQFMKWTEMTGYEVKQDYKYFLTLTTQQLNSVEKEKPWLFPEEVEKMYKYDGNHTFFGKYEPWKLEPTIDALLFNSMVGLRFNDLMNVSINQFTKGEHGWVLNRLTNKEKTKTAVLISGMGEEIFLRRKKGLTGNDLLFKGIYGLHHANELIKKWGEKAGLDRPFTQTWTKGKQIQSKTLPLHEFLSTHCMRVTKATNFIYDSIKKHNFCDPYTLCRVVGWKNISTAEIYIKSVGSLLIDQQAKLL